MPPSVRTPHYLEKYSQPAPVLLQGRGDIVWHSLIAIQLRRRVASASLLLQPQCSAYVGHPVLQRYCARHRNGCRLAAAGTAALPDGL
eukprot:COSAG01_NODE_1257_length_11020_cov_5.619723_9_plen_88_part_00